MFAVYATHAAPDDPLSALSIGDIAEPTVPNGWVRVKVSHASLNRHDLFTLRGISGHPEGITYPMIVGNDAVGTLDDGASVPRAGGRDLRRLDPASHRAARDVRRRCDVCGAGAQPGGRLRNVLGAFIQHHRLSGVP